MLLESLSRRELISPPPQVMHGRTLYLCYMGSVAYGVSDIGSDVDVYGWCIPKKEEVFPHLTGEIQASDDNTNDSTNTRNTT